MKSYRSRFAQISLMAISAVLAGTSARAQVVTNITPDATAGTMVTTVGTETTISGGVTAGANLFQSFDTFDLAEGNTATWACAGACDAYHFLINRVTGGDVSDIYGTIDTKAFGKADFWFINPAGIIVGETGKFNVAGGVTLSTADSIGFAGTTHVLLSSTADGSTFSAAAPQSFGFLANANSGWGKITLKGIADKPHYQDQTSADGFAPNPDQVNNQSAIDKAAGKNENLAYLVRGRPDVYLDAELVARGALNIIGRDIQFENYTIVNRPSPIGAKSRMVIAAIGQTPTNLTIADANGDTGKINEIDQLKSAGGNLAGTLRLFNGAEVDYQGDAAGKGLVPINSKGDADPDGKPGDTYFAAGDIDISPFAPDETGPFKLNNDIAGYFNFIRTRISQPNVDMGSLWIYARNTAKITGTILAGVAVNPHYGLPGAGGDVTIEAGNLTFGTLMVPDPSLKFFSGIGTESNGSSANIRLTGRDALTLNNVTVTSRNGSGVGTAGKITIEGSQIDVTSSVITSSSTGSGAAGTVSLTASGTAVNLRDLTIKDSSIESEAGQDSTGAGEVLLTSRNGQVTLENSSVLVTNASLNALPAGAPAAQIKLDGKTGVSIHGRKVGKDQSISAQTSGVQDAGRITVTSGDAITVGSTIISSSSIASGAAGSIELSAKGDLTVKDDSKIESEAGQNSAQAGFIKMTAGGTLLLQNSDVLATNNSNVAPARLPPGSAPTSGIVLESAGDLSITKTRDRVGGASGAYYVLAETLGVQDAGSVVITSKGGNITLTRAVVGGGSFGAGAAGSVVVEAYKDLTISDSGLYSTAEGFYNPNSPVHALRDVSHAGQLSLVSGGNLSIISTGNFDATDVSVRNHSSRLNSSANSGITIQSAGDLRIAGTSARVTSIASETFGKQDAGSVKIASTEGSIDVSHASISSAAMDLFNGPTATGAAGSIEIKAAGDLTVKDASTIKSTAGSISSGAGLVSLISSGGKLSVVNSSVLTDTDSSHQRRSELPISEIKLDGKTGVFVGVAAGTNQSISAQTSGFQDAGRIIITSSDGGIEVNWATISSDAEAAATGAAGSIALNASGDLAVSNASTVKSTAAGSSAGAGSVLLTSTGGKVSLANSSIQTDTASTNQRRTTLPGSEVRLDGKAGVLVGVAAGSNQSISAKTSGVQDAGGITIASSSGGIEVNSAIISSDAETAATGAAGSIVLNSAGDLAVKDDSTIESTAGKNSARAGIIKLISGLQLLLENSDVFATNYSLVSSPPQVTGSLPASGVILQSAGDLEIVATKFKANPLTGAYYVLAHTEGVQDAGSVTVTSIGGSVRLTRAHVAGNSVGTGAAGSVVFEAYKDLTVTDSGLYSTAEGHYERNGPVTALGNSASAGQLLLQSGGNVSVISTGNFDATDMSVRNYSATDNSSKIAAIRIESGGDLSVSGTSDRVTSIASETYGVQNAGTVSLVSKGGLLAIAHANISSASGDLITGPSGTGAAGNVNLSSSGDLTITEETTIQSTAGSVSSGAGSILLTSTGGKVSMANSSILTDTSSAIPQQTGHSFSQIKLDGKAGVSVIGHKTGKDQSISAQTSGIHDAGRITVSSGGGIDITSAVISSDAEGDAQGAAGSVSLVATGDLTVRDTSTLKSTAAGNSAGAGSVVLASTSGRLSLQNSSALTDNNSILQRRADLPDTAITLDGKTGVSVGIVGGTSQSISAKTSGVQDAGRIKIASSNGGVTVDSAVISSSSTGGSATLLGGAAGSLEVSAAGDLAVKDDSKIESDAGQYAASAGLVKLIAGDQLTLENSDVFARNHSTVKHSGAAPAAGIVLESVGNLSVVKTRDKVGGSSGSYYIAAETTGEQDAGSVTITSKGGNVTLDRAVVSDSSFGTGAAGPVTLVAHKDLTVADTGLYSVAEEATALHAGNLSLVSGGNLSIISNGLFDTTVLSVRNRSSRTDSGTASGITLKSAGDLKISGTTDRAVSIASETFGVQDAGSLKIASAGSIEASHTDISSASRDLATGAAGSIELNAAGNLAVKDGSTIKSTAVASSAGAGSVSLISQGGKLSVVNSSVLTDNDSTRQRPAEFSVSAITLDGKAGVSIGVEGGTSQSISAKTSGAQDAGKITIASSDGGIDVKSAIISSDAEAAASGAAGTIKIEANGSIDTARNVTVAESTIKSTAAANSAGAGSVSLASVNGKLTLTDSAILTTNKASQARPSGASGTVPSTSAIILQSAGDLTITGGVTDEQGTLRTVSAETTGKQDAGWVTIESTGGKIEMKKAAIRSSSRGTGAAGNVTIRAEGTVEGAQDLTLTDSEIDSTAEFESAGAGSVLLTSIGGKISLEGHSLVNTITYSRTARTVPGPSTITLQSKGDLSMTGPIGEANYPRIFAATYGVQDAGSVSIESKEGKISASGAFIVSSSYDFYKLDVPITGKAGNVELIAKADLSLTNGTLILSGADTTSTGAGKVSLAAGGKISLAGNTSVSTENNSSVFRDTEFDSGVSLEADGDISVGGGSDITTNTGGKQDAGGIVVDTVKNIILTGATIQAKTTANGKAGLVKITSADLKMSAGQVSSDTTGIGAAGNVQIQVETATLTDAATISSSSEGASSGPSGSIDIGSKDAPLTSLRLEKGASITTSSDSLNSAGDIKIFANTFELDGNDATNNLKPMEGSASSVSSNNSFKSGATGLGPLAYGASTTGLTGASPGSSVAGQSPGNGGAGAIEITGNILKVVNGGLISSSAVSGPAGSITLTSFDFKTATPGQQLPDGAPRIVIQDGGKISTDSTSGKGGNITLTVPDKGYILLNGADPKRLATITTNSGAAGGGTITVFSPFAIIAHGSDIEAKGEGESAEVKAKSKYWIASTDRVNILEVNGSLVRDTSFSDVSAGTQLTDVGFLDASKVLNGQCRAVHASGETSQLTTRRAAIGPFPSSEGKEPTSNPAAVTVACTDGAN